MIKGFIEVHEKGNEQKPILVNTKHIIEVRGNEVYTDEMLPIQTDYSYIICVEDYHQIVEKIREAMEGGLIKPDEKGGGE